MVHYLLTVACMNSLCKQVKIKRDKAFQDGLINVCIFNYAY